ncbi:MAG TPA: cupin domain-containing protein [Terriglobales bacterium]|nr:cupin domain-containing protein [Terriglobales bacterium]
MRRLRRDFCFALSAVLASSCRLFAGGKTLPSQIYEFDNLPPRTAGNVALRQILEGPTFEGCHISLHESDLAPHTRPHPPHRHRHEEMVFVVEGTLEFTINGKTIRAGEGSVLFAGSNDEHGIFNPESTHAKYFVLALGS